MNTFLFELTTRSLILAGIGLALRFALLRSSAHARANVLALTMGALALLPIALLALPRMSVTVAHQEVMEAPANAVTSVMAPAQQFTFPWMIIWVAIASLMIAQVVTSLVKFRRLELGFTPATASLTERVKQLAARARGVFFCPEGEPPMTWGLLQPKIALPTESEAWIEPQLRSVVLHEDAHIRRKDWAVMIGFRVITSLYWFNPLVWALKMLFEQDSERAADDFVLAQGIDGPEYAGRLVEVAKTLKHRQSRVPAITMARSHRLNGRVAAILSSQTQRGILKGWTRLTVLGILAIGAVATGMIIPVVKQVRLSAKTPEKLVASNETISSKDMTVDTKSDVEEPWSTEDFIGSEVDNVSTPTPPVTPKPAKTQSKSPAKTNKPNLMTASKDEPGDSEFDLGSISDIVNQGLKQAKKDLEDMPELNTRFDQKEARKDAMRARAEHKKSLERDLKETTKEIEDDVRKSLDEAKREIAGAKLISDKEMRDAEAEIDKADMPESARKIAKQTLALSQGIVGGLLKGFMEDPKSKKKPKKETTEAKHSKCD